VCGLCAELEDILDRQAREMNELADDVTDMEKQIEELVRTLFELHSVNCTL